MKNYRLDVEEQQILADIEKGKYKSIPRVKEEIEKIRTYAKNTLNKSKNINIRLSAKDVQKLKTKAVENGLPYQTLVATVLHHFANNKIRVSF